ncbi:DinB/UmuC family translesion DNA polymerase [Pseudomonas turukhanskensis]|uniref:DinB/UmuC family translesion DNA polymerase n=1 Tax=Pseudomonas turukhanskensis TaxID=1806536 RepID=UPI0022F2B5D5
MFGHRLKDLPSIREAVTSYCTGAAEKLRAQQSVCHQIRVSIRTGCLTLMKRNTQTA